MQGSGLWQSIVDRIDSQVYAHLNSRGIVTPARNRGFSGSDTNNSTGINYSSRTYDHTFDPFQRNWWNF